MNTSTTDATIDNYFTLLKNRDRKGLLAILHDDIRVVYYGPQGLLPWIGEYTGHAGFLHFLDIIAENLDIVEVQTLDRISDTRKVVVQCAGSWRVRTSGAVVSGNMVNVFTVRDDKIAAYEVYNDTAAFAAGMNAPLKNLNHLT